MTTIDRRAVLAGAAATAALASRARAQPKPDKVRFGFATKSVSPIVGNIIIPERLGYYAREGLTVECIPLGSNQAVLAAIDAKRVEFGVGVPSFQLPMVAKGDKLPGVNFYEYTYPFKWGMAVKPDSPVKSLADLRGKRIGVSGFGLSEYPVGRAVMTLAGFNAEKDVSWLAVGEGVPAGQALERGDIDGLFFFDTGFGAIEAAGIKLRYLDMPPNVPKTGGLYLSAAKDTLTQHRAWAVGLARGTAKASVFIRANPEAAAFSFLQMFPEAGPKATSLADQVKAIMVPIVKRMPLFASYDTSVTQWGRISPAEWKEEAAFLGLEGKVGDTSAYWTNDLIDEINQFDAKAIEAEAKAFKLPYKAG